MDDIALKVFVGIVLALISWVIVDRAENGGQRRRGDQRRVEQPPVAQHPYQAAGWEYETADRAIGNTTYARLRNAEEEAGRLAEMKAGNEDWTGDWRGVVGLIKASRKGGDTKVNESWARDLFMRNKEG
jgi:hypothetical protein